MTKNKFFLSSAIYTLSLSLSTAASFLLLPFYTNTHLLQVSDFGALSLYIGLSLLVQVVASFSLDGYVGVSYHELSDRPNELKAKIASFNGYMIVNSVIIIALFLALGNFFIHAFIPNSKPQIFRYVMMSVLTGIFNAHFKFYSNLLIHKEQPLRYFLSNLLNFITTIGFSLIVLVKYPLTLEGPLWGRLLSCFCIFLVSFFGITYNYGLSFEKKFLNSTFRYCLPLLVTAIFQWVLGYSDRYIIKPLLFNSELAIFDLAARFTLLVTFILDGLISALAPKIYSLLKEGGVLKYEDKINRYYNSFNLIMLIIVPLNILVFPIILPVFISDEKYLSAFLYFGIICASLITKGIQNIFIYQIYFFGKTNRFVIINGISAVLQIMLGYLMVKYFKLYGAAITLSVVRIISTFLYFYFCSEIVSEKINRKKLILLPLLSIIIISIPEFFISKYGLQMHVIHALEAITVFILVFSVYKNEFPEILKLLKNMHTSEAS